MEFITTKAGAKQYKFNPERALVRFQLMEVILRLAVHKFFKSKEVKSMFEAVKKILENRAGAFLRSFDSHNWRSTILWCEPTDIIYKSYMPVIKMLFKENSGRYTKPGFSNFMSLEEFTDLVTNTGICTENFGQREIGIHFCLAKQTEINELDFDKNREMNQLEFIEAIARVADKVTIDNLQSRLAIEEEEEEKSEDSDDPESGENL